jgi:glyoxylase-like metal-dependent hydrolase (beta-lactamase superfamily II)
MMRHLGWGVFFLLAVLGLHARTAQDQGFFEDGTIDLEVKTFPVSIDQRAEKANCHVAWLPETRLAVVIDPGAPQAEILEFVRARRLNVLAVLNTHGHADHCAGDGFLAARLSVPVYIHGADKKMASRVAGADCPIIPYPNDRFLILDGWEIEVIPAPGHTPGSVCLRIGEALFSGDTLFAGAIGKAEPQANLRLEVQNIRRFLLILPPTTRVFPGHGPATTIGAEKAFNPYLIQ